MTLDELIVFYNEFSPASVVRFPEFYSESAYFKDPFNEVRGSAPAHKGPSSMAVGRLASSSM